MLLLYCLRWHGVLSFRRRAASGCRPSGPRYNRRNPRAAGCSGEHPGTLTIEEKTVTKQIVLFSDTGHSLFRAKKRLEVLLNEWIPARLANAPMPTGRREWSRLPQSSQPSERLQHRICLPLARRTYSRRSSRSFELVLRSQVLVNAASGRR